MFNLAFVKFRFDNFSLAVDFITIKFEKQGVVFFQSFLTMVD
jgi:hypothetical protein